jgi:hypothetical protein
MSRRKKDRSAVENNDLSELPERYPPPEPHPPRPNKPLLAASLALLLIWWLFLLTLASGG